MEPNINSFLQGLENSANLISVYVPSQGKEVKFKPLNARQHKEILSSALDNTASGVSLAITLSECIVSNAIERVPFLSTDKMYIITALRAASLSPEYKQDDKVIDLNKVIAVKLPLSEDIKSKLIEEGNLKIKAIIPTLDQDYAVNKETRKKIKGSTASDKETARDSLSEIYTNEFVKYIESVEFNPGDGAVNVEFAKIPFTSRQKIVERIPLTAASKLMSYITTIKEAERAFFVVDGVSVDTIDQSFFTI